MSNNPPLPPPDMDAFEATMIRARNPVAKGYIDNLRELGADAQVIEAAEEAARQIVTPQQAPPIKNRARPRRGPVREKLLDRDDWKVLAIIMFMAFAAGMLGGAVFLLMINHI